jgi:L-ornithine Nalpha-acyltransferase
MSIWQTRMGRVAPGAVSLPSRLARLTGLEALSRKPGQYQLSPFKREIAAKSYGRVGNLEVRLARTRIEIRLAQRLRYQVFYEEMSAIPTRLAQFRRRDEDAYDTICDHLIVVDLDKTAERHGGGDAPKPVVVGTYRILRQDIANRSLGFYTASEYDIAPLLRARSATHSFMELGRSCVLAPYRNKRTIELLWHGLWTYVREHGVDVMLGCASFPGTDPTSHAEALSFLHHNALAKPEWRCRAHGALHVPMDMLPADRIDTRRALKAMPPLIKAYLRLGAKVGDGAVIDRQFGTTDVFIVLPVEDIDPRYFDHYGAPDEAKSRVAVDT